MSETADLSDLQDVMPLDDGSSTINEVPDQPPVLNHESISHEIDLGLRDPMNNLQLSGKLTWDKNDAGDPNPLEELSGNLAVEIPKFEKIGDGMGAYVLFTIHTTTNIPVFRSNEMTVRRRFSDFLGLYLRLQTLHTPKGILVPPPPDKQNFDSNKYKFVKDAAKENDFLEQRRIALLHFIENLIRHPALRTDAVLREFLEYDGALPKAIATQTLSGSTASKLFKTVSDAIGKISTHADDTDEYFFQKAQHFSNMDRQFTRLMHSFNAITTSQAELSTSIVNVMQSLDQLSTVEQDNHLAVKIKRLSGVYDVLGKHEVVRAQAESVYLCEMSRSIVATIHAAKALLDERSRLFRKWKDTEELLSSKRAQKTKLELSNKMDLEKVNLLQAKINLTEQNVEECKTQFESMCKTIKEEFKRFDLHRFYDLRASMLAYLEVLLSVQQKNQEAWESYYRTLESGSL